MHFYYTIKLQCFQCWRLYQPDKLVIYLNHLVFLTVNDFFFVDDDFVNQLVEDPGVEFGDVGVFFNQFCKYLCVLLGSGYGVNLGEQFFFFCLEFGMEESRTINILYTYRLKVTFTADGESYTAYAYY